MHEDGKKRHIYQLKPQKQEVLKLIPDKTLKQHFQCMENSIQGVKFPQSLCKCCWTSKFKRVDPLFVTAFDQLQVQQKVSYYRKYVEQSRMLAKKKSRLPQTNNFLDDFPTTREMINVLYRMGGDKKWKDLTITLDNTTKILESPLFRIDLHQTFVIKPKNTESCILLKSWTDNRKDLYLKSDKQNFNVLFQRIQKNSRQATEENIFRIIDGENKIRVSETNEDEVAPSERILDQRINVSNSSRHTVKHSIKYVSLANFLTYRHPTEPLIKENQIKRLNPTKANQHYYLEDDWEINSDGELVVVNQKKLEAQGSVISYIIKRLFTGSKIFNISLPVTVFNQQSNLSLLLCSYAHAPLQLEYASLEKNALKRFLKVIRFSLLGPCCYIRCDKPFNPILGQTYQAIVNGTLLYGEQVSHHPPISSLFIEGRGYTAYGSFQAQLRFGANSAKGNNKGWFKISFDRENILKKIVKVSNIPGQMGGMLIGKRTLNMVDQSYYIDQQNLLFLCLTFGEAKITKKKRFYDSVEGKIVKLKSGTPLDKPEEITQVHIDQQLGIISGRWLSQVFFNELLLIDTRSQTPPEIQRYPALLPSDYSLRQDITLKHKGADNQQCQYAKQKLEEIQRNDRKLREKYKK